MPTWPNTSRLAAATQALPGPTILSTGCDAFGAIGQRRDRLRPADAIDIASRRRGCAAASTSGLILPPLAGVTITMRADARHRAGIAFISTDDG